MFIDNQSKSERKIYADLYKALASLSGLFSDSETPYIPSRASESIFCYAFQAENHSRSDTSVDASKNNVGIGIKTFVHGNGATFQKIAEFNHASTEIKKLSLEEKINYIAKLRNERLSISKRAHNVSSLLYHCVTRQKGKLLVFEEEMLPIDIAKIKIHKHSDSSVYFSDEIHEYNFYNSKSVLTKRFNCSSSMHQIPIRIIENPFLEIKKFFDSNTVFQKIRNIPHVFLPLYSTASKTKAVPEKSGLNQWNAAGRVRNFNEVYLPIPAWIKKVFPNFFPDRTKYFDLMLTNGEKLQASVCQDGDKSIMSKPNDALGLWLLRDVLNLAEGELLKYSKLEQVGLDSVVIYKINSDTYDIDFTKLGSYENFRNEFDTNYQRRTNNNFDEGEELEL